MTTTARHHAGGGFEPGEHVEGYRVVRALGGGAGREELYELRAEDGSPATLVAGTRPNRDRRARARFRRLAAARTGLEHSALIPVLSYGEVDGRPYLLAAEHPERTLADLIEAEAPLAPERLMAMLGPVVEALDLAHRNGVVHQALDARSLLLDEDDRLRIDTFAVAGAGADADWMSAEPADLRYRPPEQLRGEELGPAANVYSLAAVIVHALTGEPPYGGGRTAVTYGHLVEPAPRVSSRVRTLGPPVDRALRQAMTKDPTERPPPARALLAVAQALGTQARPAVEARDVLLETEPEKLPSPWRRLALPTGVTLAAVCGVLAAVALNPFAADEPSQPAPAPGSAALKRLDDRRTELRALLVEAGTPQRQAALASSLAAAHSAVAGVVPPGPRAEAARSAAAAYSELAAAAESGDEGAYLGAAGALNAAEERLVLSNRPR